MSKTKFISNFFAASGSSVANKFAIEIPCSGINNQTYKRPRAQSTRTILAMIQRSPTPYHGNPPRYQVCLKLFKTSHEKKLTPDQREKLHQYLESHSRWLIRRHGDQKSIHSPKCLRVLPSPAKKEGEVVVCTPCLDTKNDRSLIQAINRDYAEGDNVKFIPRTLMTSDQFQAILIRHSKLME